jgi:hypothetical protein
MRSFCSFRRRFADGPEAAHANSWKPSLHAGHRPPATGKIRRKHKFFLSISEL